MPRARLIPPDLLTSEAVVDCAPMTRLPLLGLSSFADDFGVLALRPRTLRLQVFPGDALDDDQVRAMLDELVSRGLVRRYAVEGVDYLSIVDGEVHQRVGRRARRCYPADPSQHEAHGPRAFAIATLPNDCEADQRLTVSPGPPNHNNPVQGAASAPRALSLSEPSAADAAADAAWCVAVESAGRRAWGANVPGDVALHAARWRAEGRDLVREVLPAIERTVGIAVGLNLPFRLERVDRAMAG